MREPVVERELNFERAWSLPLCPMDGQPLRQYTRSVNGPSLFVHGDGTEHQDSLAELLAMKPPPPPVPLRSILLGLPEWASEVRSA